MLFLALLFSAASVLFFALLPSGFRARRCGKNDILCAVLPTLAAWVWAACVYSKPGLSAGFDGFRLLAVCGSVVTLCLLVFGWHARKKVPQKAQGLAAAVLLAFGVLAAELFVGNLNFFATHSYTPVDLRPYLTEQAEQPDGALLSLKEENNTLTFAGLDQPIYNLRLDGLRYDYDGPHADAQDPLMILTVGATDAASGTVRQSWPWPVAVKSPLSLTHSLDLSGNADTILLTADGYHGEYRQYPLRYTLTGVTANVPRPLCLNWVRMAVLFALAGAAFALRPGSVLWRQRYLAHRKSCRPLVVLCGGTLCLLAFLAPFADRYSVGVATNFYNTPSWDGESRITFTKHLNDEQADTAGQYGALAHSLLNGRLDLPLDPPAALTELENPYDTGARASAAPEALWDVAYYNGRYYVYFGLIPCLLFQLPFEAVTGVADLPPSVPMILMAWLYIAAAFGAVAQAIRRWFPSASVAAYLVCSTAVAGCSQLYYLLLRPSVYEYAILCGAAFVLLALWQWLAASNTDPAHRGVLLAHLALGSLCMALVAGCRPQMEYFALLALPIFAPRVFAEHRLATKQGKAEAAAFLLPVLAVAALLMAYNAARFGSVFDFGANYNLTSNDMTARGFSIGRSAPALFTQLLAAPRVTAVFPYLEAARMSTNYMGLTISEPVYGGVFACLPVLWGLAVLPLLRRRLAKQRDLRGLVAVCAAAPLLLTLLDSQMAGVLHRYQSDFLPALLFAAALAWLLAEQILQRHEGAAGMAALQRLLRIGLLCGTAAGMAYQFCVFFAAEPGLVGQSPALFQNFSRAVQFWV